MQNDADHIHKLPCWNGNISIAPLSGGLSNANYLVTDSLGKHVVRFGKDFPFHHVSREREVMVAKAAHAAGFAPRVEYAAAGVMVTQFVEAQTFTAKDVKSNAAKIGQLMRQFHAVMPAHVSGPGFMFWPFHVIRDYLRTLQNHRNDLGQFLPVLATLERVQIPMPIIFGHHDLLPANFLSDGKKLWLIDFEYAGFGTAMFDLAGASSNAGMNTSERDDLLEAYFAGQPFTQLQQSFVAMECASLLRETLWAMVSSLFLAAPGVDYQAYTDETYKRYEASLLAYETQYGKCVI
jgi:thiamine kinase-like enzyme